MNKKNTPSKSVNTEVNSKSVNVPRVSEKTLNFLRAFASNYCVEPKLSQCILGIILSST